MFLTRGFQLEPCGPAALHSLTFPCPQHTRPNSWRVHYFSDELDQMFTHWNRGFDTIRHAVLCGIFWGRIFHLSSKSSWNTECQTDDYFYHCRTPKAAALINLYTHCWPTKCWPIMHQIRQKGDNYLSFSWKLLHQAPLFHHTAAVHRGHAWWIGTR